MYIVVVSRERYVYCVKVAAAARSDSRELRRANVSLGHRYCYLGHHRLNFSSARKRQNLGFNAWHAALRQRVATSNGSSV